LTLNVLEKLNPRQRRLSIGGGFVLLITLLFSYVLLPQIKVYRKEHAGLQALEQAVTQAEGVGMQLSELAGAVDALEKQLHGDMANLPANQLEAFVIGRLQAISWRDNVELLSVEPNNGETLSTFTESLFEVKLGGDYSDLYSWLRDIKDELGFVVIKEYDMRSVENVADNPKLTVRLKIASYRLTQA
jgi:Tfp pilus assembly protein PilO